MCHCYILYSEKLDSYYVGSTANIEDRIKRHNSGRSNYTKKGMPWKIVYIKEYETKAEAYRAEMHIKAQKSRKYIEQIIIAHSGD